MEAYIIPKSSILDLSEKLHKKFQIFNINKGYRFEDYIYDKINNEKSDKTKLIIKDKSTTLSQIECSFPYITNNGLNYYQNKVCVHLKNNDMKICDSIFIEGNVLYFVELKKNITNIDTTNINGLYSKLKSILEIETKLPFKMKGMIVSLENDSFGAYKYCKLSQEQKNDLNLEIVGGEDFLKRIGLDYHETIFWVNSNYDLENPLKEIFEEHSI